MRVYYCASNDEGHIVFDENVYTCFCVFFRLMTKAGPKNRF